jgi:hypothetical protein
MMNDSEEKRKALPLDMRLRNALDGLCDECKCAMRELLELWESENIGRDREPRTEEEQRRDREQISIKRQTENEQREEYRSV